MAQHTMSGSRFRSIFFEHDNIPVHQAKSIHKWLSQFGVENVVWAAQTQKPTNTLELQWNVESGLVEPLQQGAKVFPKERRILQQKIGGLCFWNEMIDNRMRLQRSGIHIL